MTQPSDFSGFYRPSSQPQHSGSFDSHFSIERSSVKDLFERIYEPEATYTFAITQANPHAMNMVAQERERRMKAGDKNAEFHFHFDMRVTSYFREAITRSLKSQQVTSISYPLIREVGVHVHDQHEEAPTWPHIHLLRHTNTDPVKIGLDGQLSDDVYRHIVEREAPQNYRLPVIDFLRKNHQKPLYMDPWWYSQPGETLRNVLNLTQQFVNRYTYTGNTISVD